MAVYVIGDVHGHLDLLERIVNRINPQPEDVVIQLGDCINRGPQSYEVVEYWLRFSRCTRYVLGGNHEELMFDHLSESSTQLMDFGGEATLKSYRTNGWECARGRPDSIPADHWAFYLQSLPWTRPLLATSQYVFTHAGYDFALPPNGQNPATLRWGRIQNWRSSHPTAVRGHTPQRKVSVTKRLIQVDTGCGLGGPLSCIQLPEGGVTAEYPAAAGAYIPDGSGE